MTFQLWSLQQDLVSIPSPDQARAGWGRQLPTVAAVGPPRWKEEFSENRPEAAAALLELCCSGPALQGLGGAFG